MTDEITKELTSIRVQLAQHVVAEEKDREYFTNTLARIEGLLVEVRTELRGADTDIKGQIEGLTGRVNALEVSNAKLVTKLGIVAGAVGLGAGGMAQIIALLFRGLA